MIIHFTIPIYFLIYIYMHNKDFKLKEESIIESRILYLKLCFVLLYLYSYINFEMLLIEFVTK